MKIVYIKYFFICICSIYSYTKLLNLPFIPLTKSKIVLLFYLPLLPFAIFFLRKHLVFPSVILMVALATISNKIIYRSSSSEAIVSTIISFGISYATHAICSLVTLMALFLYKSSTYSALFAMITGFVQIALTVFLFRIKRLKNGIPNLGHSNYDGLGVFTSFFVLMSFSFLGVQQTQNFAYDILTAMIFICGIALWFWWRNRMTLEYIEQERQREQQNLNKTISELNEEIVSLKKENEMFSKIIHKDNKLIPAMELAVKESMYSAAYNDDQQSRIECIQKSLQQIEAISKDRSGTVKNYEHVAPTLPSTGIGLFDALFSYMKQKAIFSGIIFNLTICEGISDLISSTIPEKDVATVLADLIENAIIAAKESRSEKQVLVALEQNNGCFYIKVYDTGPDFSEDVIQNWGLHRITTHADTGGSGIGLIQTYEICKCCHASFIIDYVNIGTPYKKCVSICFDGKEQFLVINK